ncbi:MAG: Sapep family Mn(2+)-dependent dipeptidase [Thermoanaerobaculia bacterium]
MLLVPLLLLLSAPPSAAARTIAIYDRTLAPRMVPLVSEAIRFPTVAGNEKARLDQQAWLMKLGSELGFTVRDAGPVTEVELAGPPGSKVLGLVVHGDVQPVDEERWSVPPYAGVVRAGDVVGRGAADDKGPLVQALLAMSALKASGLPLTHTVRLLVGSDEESGSSDMEAYLKSHAAPDLSLVLDSDFPVVVGEKAWNALALTTELTERAGGASFPYRVAQLEAGLSPSIVPDMARVVLRWREGTPDWKPLIARLARKKMPAGTALKTAVAEGELTVHVSGKSAHGGENLEGGRNALVALARLMEGELPRGGADDLLAFARLAGVDLYGTGLGLLGSDPIWGRYAVNVATIKDDADAPSILDPKARGAGKKTLIVVARSTPPLTGPELKVKLEALVTDFNERTGARFFASGYWDDKTLAFDPEAKIVKRLLASYARATGRREKPSISGGGTYAKRLPNAIAFGMWFRDKPYPGHDVDERVPIEDLHRGTRVLIDALVDLSTTPPIDEPFKR